MGNSRSNYYQTDNFYLREECNKLKLKIVNLEKQKENEALIKIIPENIKTDFMQLKDHFAIYPKFKNVQTGAEFKSSFIGTKDKLFIKCMKENMLHYGFQYKEGLNIDTIPFNPSGDCSAGGLYFTTIEHVKQWMTMYNYDDMIIRIVEIPDDAQVYCSSPNTNKWKADKIIIREIFDKRNIKLNEILQIY